MEDALDYSESSLKQLLKCSAKSDDGRRNDNFNLVSAFSGGIAGGTQILLTYPAEYIKTQLQLDEKGEKKLYNGTLDCIKKTYKNNGFLQFYRGMPALLYSSIPKTSIRYCILDNFKVSFSDENGSLSKQMLFLSGLTAGFVEAVLAVTPFESIKVKLIRDVRKRRPQYKGVSQGAKLIFKTIGIRGMYQGNTATILKQGINQAVRFSIAETLKDNYAKNRHSKEKMPTFVLGFFGAIAGAISVFINNPIDVIKTRMQCQDAKTYKNVYDCAMKLFKNEGWRVFYKGVVPHTLRTSADVAITHMVYETFLKFLYQT